jgi:hypothetical protein
MTISTHFHSPWDKFPETGKSPLSSFPAAEVLWVNTVGVTQQQSGLIFSNFAKSMNNHHWGHGRLLELAHRKEGVSPLVTSTHSSHLCVVSLVVILVPLK